VVPSGLILPINGLFIGFSTLSGFLFLSVFTCLVSHLLPSPPLSERRYCDDQRHAVCVCVSTEPYHVSTARCISLGGEGNALYPVLSSFSF